MSWRRSVLVAESYTLEAQAREVVGKQVSQLRVQGLVPAVIYGARFESVAVQIPERALRNTLAKAGGTHIINVVIDGAKPQTVIAREVQRHPLRGDILHVDFLAVDATTVISADIPVYLIGESPAVESRIGMLLAGLTSISIEALPADLIDRVEVDLSTLVELGDSIHVRDLDLGSKVTIKNEPDEMIARITQTSAARAEEEEEAEAAAAEGSAEPEVIARGKEEEEDF